MGDNKFQRDTKEWIDAIERNEKKAFRELFFTFHKPLCQFAGQYVHKPQLAEEVVQDVFAKIWTKRHDLDPEQSLKAYLYQSVKNKAIDYVRRHKTEQKYLREVAQDTQMKIDRPSEIKIQDTSEFEAAVNRAVQELPERGRKVYKLSRKDGLTYKEIAQVLDISPKTVETQMSRMLKKLRERLKPFIKTVLLTLFAYNLI